MKKNLMSVLILALVIVNLVFTAVLTFTILPSTKSANKLITDVAKAINLELNAGKTTGQNNVSIENIEIYKVSDGEKITIPLRKDKDGEDHFAVVGVYVSLDKTHEDYATKGATIGTKASMIKDIVIRAVSARTKSECQDVDVRDEMLEEILTDLQALCNSDVVVAVGFEEFISQ